MKIRNLFFVALVVAFSTLLSFSLATSAYAQNGTAVIKKMVPTLKGSDKDIGAFYTSVKNRPIWVGNKNSSRRRSLIAVLKTADDHGLPEGRYRVAQIAKDLREAKTPNEKAAAEINASKVFVRFAQDLNSGALKPSSIDKEIAMRPAKLGAQAILKAVAKSNPKNVAKSIMPKHPDYARLLEMKKRASKGGAKSIPDIPVATLRPGAKSKSVTLMRKKLASFGYGNTGSSQTYDKKLVATVKKFQKNQGLGADGVAGPSTIKALNYSPKSKVETIVVNLERQRWLNFERGKRHIFVNLPDFSVAVMDNGRRSFYSRTVIGKRSEDTRSPEFVDKMTHMVINPTWHVPASIAGKEYLPIIRRDPGFLRRKNMTMISQGGKAVNPANVNLASYTEDNFPYYIKQKPNPGNALGLVKFMFPNKYNIYLHDTPAKSLFNKDVRAFSHGCIRVHQPFDFAYKLLERQTSNPEATFQSILKTGKEKFVNLKAPVPVIITYQTAVFDEKGKVSYRNDIYGRDAKIARALKKAGVAL